MLPPRPAPEARPRWEAGLCPCCGGDLIPYLDSAGSLHQPAPVAVDVMMCGQCIEGKHNDIEGVLTIITALAGR